MPTAGGKLKLDAEGIFYAAIAGALFGVAALAIHYVVHQKMRPMLTGEMADDEA
jgi:hypothetical protein